MVKYSPDERRPDQSVQVVLHVPVTDFVMSGYDENGAMYRTVVLGHRTFAKVVDIPLDSSRPAAVVVQINERDYAIPGASRWTEADGQWQLEATLPAEDNQPLNDCLGDPSWTEIASGN
jgi:hypothetical protein